VPVFSHLDAPDLSGLHLDSHGPLCTRRRQWSETGRWMPTVPALASGYYSRYTSPLPHTPIPTLCVLNIHIPPLPLSGLHLVLILPSLHVHYVAPRRPLSSLWPPSTLPWFHSFPLLPCTLLSPLAPWEPPFYHPYPWHHSLQFSSWALWLICIPPVIFSSSLLDSPRQPKRTQKQHSSSWPSGLMISSRSKLFNLQPLV